MSDKYQKVDIETTKQAGNFLFAPSDDSEYLDMRTRIKSDKMSELLLYYSILGNTFGCDVATDIKDTLERILISKGKDNGREQAVKVLMQNFPKRVEVAKGSDNEF